jgi:hypothetical protein
MPVREVRFDGGSADPFAPDIVRYAHIFKATGYEIQLGVVTETNLPVIINGPLQIPADSPFVCLLSPQGKDMSIARKIFSKIRTRILSLGEHPADPDDFEDLHLLSAESVAHTTRIAACHEPNPDRRQREFKKAYDIYEGVIFTLHHQAYTNTLLSIRKGLKKATFVHPNAEMDTFTPQAKRLLSHCFAGMALCALMGEGSLIKYVSLVSISVCPISCEHAVQLAGVFRLLPLLMVTKPVSIETFVHATRLEKMHQVITEKILLPQIKRMGRDDLLAVELSYIHPDNRAECAQFAEDIARRIVTRIASPAPLTSVFTRVIDGKILERNCAACGVWDRTGKSYRRCSRCMGVYYCGTECQKAHWKAHKADCKSKAAK